LVTELKISITCPCYISFNSESSGGLLSEMLLIQYLVGINIYILQLKEKDDITKMIVKEDKLITDEIKTEPDWSAVADSSQSSTPDDEPDAPDGVTNMEVM
jgi:hypothetical protein